METSPSGENRYLRTVQYGDSSNLDRRQNLHDRFSVSRHGFHQWMFDRFALTSGARILELGCGFGQLWARNTDRIPTDCTVVLSDFSVGMLRDARTALGKSRERFGHVAADAQFIPFDDRRFDAVVANHMLYLVPDRPAALAEIRRVLRPDGQLYASANGLRHLRELGDLVRQYEPEYTRGTGGAHRFGLENGREQLLEYFDQVDLHRYDDALIVTDPQALVHWAKSWAPAAFEPERLADFYSFLANEAFTGEMRVSKDSGLFIAQGWGEQE